MSNSGHSKKLAIKIIPLLRASHRKLWGKVRLSSAALFGAIFLGGISLLILFEINGFYPAWVKSTVLFVILLGAAVASFLISRGEFATLRSFTNFVETFFRFNKRERVRNAVDLLLNKQQKQSRFYEAAIDANLKSVRMDEIISELKEFAHQSKPHKRFRISVVLLLFSLLSLSILGFSRPSESLRALHFWNEFDRPNPFAFSVTPGDTTIQHGSSIRSSIHFQGNRIPGRVFLAFKTDVEEELRLRPMEHSGEGHFLSPELELTNNISYHIEMDGFTSDPYRVNVQLPPRFDRLSATITSPPYTGLSENTLEYPFAEISLYPGSVVEIEGITNKPVQSISVMQNGEQMNLDPADRSSQNHFMIRFTPERSDTLSFQLRDQEGLKNQNPFRTVLHLREDQHPTVVIEEPTGTVFETNPEQLHLLYLATDDFGLTRAELRWELRRAFVEEPIQGNIALERPRNGITESVRWDLNELSLRPRDEVTFRIRVWDNDEISGPKWSDSQPVMLQIPSLTEYFEDLDSRERDVQGELDRISDNFRNMEQEYEQFLERLRQTPEGGFEEGQMLEQIRERQESIDEAVKKINEEFEQIRSELRGNEMISEETRQAYQELQRLMDELDDPALREAMEQLQKALEEMLPQELERALENVAFNENLYRERLQRTVELFKRLKMNSDLDKLARQYEEMAERVSHEESRSLDQLSGELETVQNDMDKVSQQLEGLDNDPPLRSEEMLRQLKENAQQELEKIQEQLEQLREDVVDEAGSGASEPSDQIEEQQQQLSQQLQQEADKLRESVQQMSGQQIQVNLVALQRALYTLLELSEVQEVLTQQTSNTRNRSQGFVELAREQKNISDQFLIVADTLFQISSELPGIPNQVNRKKAEVERTLGRTMDQMIERNQRGATITSRESLGGINDLTSMVASLIDQLMDQQGGGGGGMSMQQMVEQLQQMSGDQQQLNQQLQDLINDVQGERLTREESERLDQLARQQNEIRRQLQELQRGGGLEQGDRALSELQRMLEEMEDSINDMRGGVTDPLMVERQQNILSRMLNAEEAIQQRGEEEEREGTRASGYERTPPPDITLQELQQEIRSRLQDPNYTRFSEQYQRLIERYFERLRRIEEIESER